MGLRFRKSFRIMPGVRINISKGGLSTSFGVPGATVNLGRQGIRGTVGIPGTGLSYSAKIGAKPRANRRQFNIPDAEFWEPPIPNAPSLNPQHAHIGQRVNEIASEPIEHLTSPSLLAFREMLVDAKAQQAQIREDFAVSQAELKKATRLAKWLGAPGIRTIVRSRHTAAAERVRTIQQTIRTLNEWMIASQVEADFELSATALTAFSQLADRYVALSQCRAVWDITTDAETDRVRTRSIASRSLERMPIRIEYGRSEFIDFSGRALRLPNASGHDLLLYPGVLVMERADGYFALLDLRDVQLTAEIVQFIESEAVPPDTRVVGQTWLKANKDGSPDRRFAGNRQIPICEYVELRFWSRTGLNEAYMCSNASVAMAFKQAFSAHQNALNS